MSGCKYRRILSVQLGISNLEYEICMLADESAMVHREQCLECTIAKLEKGFDCAHMRPVKLFTSGGKSNELTECTKSGEILDEGRDRCKRCTQKEGVSA